MDDENAPAAVPPSVARDREADRPLDPVLLSDRIPLIEARLARFSSAETEHVVRRMLAVCADRRAPLLERISAGHVLALLGDPRIRALQPTLCRVPGGSFRMGLDEDRCPELAGRFAVPLAWLRKATPVHVVELDAYEIARFPVTEQEYRQFLEETQVDALPHGWAERAPRPERRNHPVHGIPWSAVLLYTEWLQERTGRQYRVPSEAEWERAARGTDERDWPWGDRFEAALCNTREGGVGDTTPVGVYPGGASPCGALDMAGNVEEYVADLYWPYPGSAFVDAETGSYRMTRGGVFSLDADLARCERRHGTPYAGATGFRLALSAADEWLDRDSPSAGSVPGPPG
jgi:toxoflavin biosynthesis protein ToxD